MVSLIKTAFLKLKIAGERTELHATKIERALASLEGVIVESVDLLSMIAYIRYDATQVSAEEIAGLLADIGYSSEVLFSYTVPAFPAQ